MEVDDKAISYRCPTCTLFVCRELDIKDKEQRKQVRGEDIKAFRKKKKWSQSDLAMKLGIPSYKISRMETEKDLPSKKLLEVME